MLQFFGFLFFYRIDKICRIIIVEHKWQRLNDIVNNMVERN
jgi:hypothetical protein